MAINDLTDAGTYCPSPQIRLSAWAFSGNCWESDAIVVNRKTVQILSERNPSSLPWSDMNVDVAIESTGVFAKAESERVDTLTMSKPEQKVILTVPAKDDIATLVLGVNNDTYTSDVQAWSNASCTTNCLRQ